MLLHKASIRDFLVMAIFLISNIVIVGMLIKFFVLKEDERLSYNVKTKFYDRNKFDIDMKTFSKKKENFVIVVFDLDNLKQINDNYGHSIGDLAIQTFCSNISQILEKSLRYRSGGDEFVIIMENEYEARYLIEKIKQMSKEERMKVSYKGKEISVDFSFGVASTLKDGGNIKKLYDIADNRMYIMKNSKKKVKNYKRVEI
jgi:diguanylate cyclase (GGDEF)-like protein